MQNETVVLINTYVYIYTYIHVTTKNEKEAMHLKESKEKYVGVNGERKGGK